RVSLFVESLRISSVEKRIQSVRGWGGERGKAIPTTEEETGRRPSFPPHPPPPARAPRVRKNSIKTNMMTTMRAARGRPIFAASSGLLFLLLLLLVRASVCDGLVAVCPWSSSSVGVGVGVATTTTTAARLYVDGGEGSSSSSSSSSSFLAAAPFPPSRRRCDDDDGDDDYDASRDDRRDGRRRRPYDPFEVWGKMRLGLGSGPGSNPSGVYWVGSGSLREAYTGRTIATFEGYDVGRGMRVSEDTIRQISRKIFWFRDPRTGALMTEYEGRPVRPVVYDAQVIDYHRRRRRGGGGGGDGDDEYYDECDDDNDDGDHRECVSIEYSVEASLRRLKGSLPPMKITSRMAGPSQMMINVPVFIDVPVPSESSSSGGGGGGRYRAWEYYDYIVDPTFPPDRPPTAVWCRQGSVPPFFGVDDPNAVLRFSGHRVDRYEDLPERMRIEVERSYPHFVGPPRDVEDAMRRAEGPER
ncbi:hypothetical protein ACHAW5_009608, partial [Stephanodiscus triporus]